MSMDLEELIRISEEQPEQPDPIDLQLTTNTHLSRLQSPSPDVVSASFRALGTVAKFKPDLIEEAIPQAVSIISSEPASPASYGAFSLLTEVLLSDPNRVFELKGIVNLACEAARVEAATKQLKPDALLFIKSFVETEKFKDAIKHSNTYPFFDIEYSLAKFTVGCLGSRESIELAKELLSIPAALDHFISNENVSYETSFIDSLTKSGIFEQAFGFIEREKCCTDACIDMLEFVEFILCFNCDIVIKGTIRESFYREIELLADFIHSSAYYYLTALASGEKNQLETMLLQKSLEILTLICTKSDEKNVHEKAQNFARDSKILNYLLMIVCSVSDEQLEEHLEISAQAMQILERLIHNNMKAQTKLCTTIITGEQNTQIDVFQRLSQLAMSHQNARIYKYSLELLIDLFSGDALATSFCASLSKPVRSAARGNVGNGLRLILGSFTGGIERAKPNNSPFSQFVKQCGEQYKREVASIAPPAVDVSVSGAAVLVQDALSASSRSSETSALLGKILQFEEACLHFAISTFVADIGFILQNPHVETLATSLLLRLIDSNFAPKEPILSMAAALSLKLTTRFWMIAVAGLEGLEGETYAAIAYLRDHAYEEYCACVLVQLPTELAVLFANKHKISLKSVYEQSIATLESLTKDTVYENIFEWVENLGLQPILKRIDESHIVEERMHQGEVAGRQETSTTQLLSPVLASSESVPLEKYQELKTQYDRLQAENLELREQLESLKTGIIGGESDGKSSTNGPQKIETLVADTPTVPPPAFFSAPDIMEISEPSESGSAGHTRRRQKMVSQSGSEEIQPVIEPVEEIIQPPPPSQKAPEPAEQDPEEFFG